MGQTNIVVVELLKHEMMLEVEPFEIMMVSPAFALACFYDYSDIVLELLKHDRVDVNLENNNGDTALIHSELDWPYQHDAGVVETWQSRCESSKR